MSDWLKTDEQMKKKYEDFKTSNKKFAAKFDTYDKFVKEIDNATAGETAPPPEDDKNKTTGK